MLNGVFAALNPYRRRPDSGNTPGFVYQLHTGTNVTPDPMSKLVYRVHPIPPYSSRLYLRFWFINPRQGETLHPVHGGI